MKIDWYEIDEKLSRIARYALGFFVFVMLILATLLMLSVVIKEYSQ